MKYSTVFNDNESQVTLTATVPLPKGLPPLAELQMRHPPFPVLCQIEALLPKFLDELLCRRT